MSHGWPLPLCCYIHKLLLRVLALSHGDFTTHLRFPARTLNLAFANLGTD